MNEDRVTCGDVGFKDAEGKYQGICGPERVALLRAFYLRQSTEPLTPCDLRMGQGWRTLEWSEVAWETCGEEVTAPEARYKVYRYFNSGRKKLMRRGLTLADARAWCSREDTHKAGSWFDGFTKEGK